MGASKLSDGEGLRGARDSGVLGQDARDAGRGTEDEAGCAAGGHNAQIGLRPAACCLREAGGSFKGSGAGLRRRVGKRHDRIHILEHFL